MTKKSGRMPRKRIITGVIIGLIILGGAAGYYLYAEQQGKQKVDEAARQKKTVEEQRTKLDEVSFRGDKAVAASYLERIEANDKTGAVKVYENAAKSVPLPEQIVLYRSAITAARQAEQDEHTLLFSLKLAELQPDYRIYAAIAQLYAARQDSAREVEYLQKAISNIDAMPHDSAVYLQLLPIYQAKLDKAQG